MRNETKRNGIIIGALLITIALMTVGYAALATQLTINGTASMEDASWNIEFSSITKNTILSTAGATEVSAPTASGTAASFNVSLAKPGEKMVYDIIVKNSGSIDAIFKQMNGVDEINATSPQDITYTVQRLDTDDSIITGEGDLLNGETHKFRVTIEWSSASSSLPVTTAAMKTGTIYFDYQQK